MLSRVDLSDEQSRQLCMAWEESNGASRLDVEDGCNITPNVEFLSTRFLTLPRIQAHGRVHGDERDYEIMLARLSDGFAILRQPIEPGEEDQPWSVSSFIVLQSNLDFAPENRTDGWALRLRRMLMEIAQWTLDTGKPLLDRPDDFPGKPLWDKLRPECADQVRMFGKDSALIRRVLAGKADLAAEKREWLIDQDAAQSDLADLAFMRGVEQNLLDMTRRSPRP